MPPTMSRRTVPGARSPCRACRGGTNWPGGAYDPETNIVYVYSKTQMAVTGIIPNTEKSVSDFDYVHGTVGAAVVGEVAMGAVRPDAGGGGRGGRGGRGDQPPMN